MREIRLYGSEGGGAVGSPYPYPVEVVPGVSFSPAQRPILCQGDISYEREFENGCAGRC